MTKQLYSNGKLLLTGEYAILDGAKGFALPTKFGQYLNLSQNTSDMLDWISLDEKDEVWFSGKFSKSNFAILDSTDGNIAKRLLQLLSAVRNLNPNFLTHTTDYNLVETKLTFPSDWGLGSSSTLIANTAHWASIDPYELLAATFGGSGYDIACASHDRPIIYKTSKKGIQIKEVTYKPAFSEHLFFVYLNEKKNSRDAIRAYRTLQIDKSDFISKINAITYKIARCSKLSEFEKLLDTHEEIISKTLQIPTVKESLFPDYKGTIKSLGAWGGDFILATGNKDVMDYFEQKGYTTILPYAKMIL